MLQLEDAGRNPFEDLPIPPALEERIQRHRTHLAELVSSMKSAGFSEAQIETSITVLVDSYRQELIQTMKILMRE